MLLHLKNMKMNLLAVQKRKIYFMQEIVSVFTQQISTPVQ